jgi:hypothetical protein
VLVLEMREVRKVRKVRKVRGCAGARVREGETARPPRATATGCLP